MKLTKWIAGSSAVVLAIVGLVSTQANAHKKYITATAAYYQNGTGFSTIFSGGTSPLNTVSTGRLAKFHTVSGANKTLFASKSTARPLFY